MNTRDFGPRWQVQEQRVLAAALVQCFVSSNRRGPYVVKQMASLNHFRRHEADRTLDDSLIRHADRCEPALGEALRSMVINNAQAVPIVVSRRRFPRLVVVSDKDLDKAYRSGSDERWENFYKTYPGARGEIDVSRPGLSTDGSCAIIYVGCQAWDCAGFGQFWVFRQHHGRWRLTREEVGPRWRS